MHIINIYNYVCVCVFVYELMNEWSIYIVLYFVLLYIQSTLQSCTVHIHTYTHTYVCIRVCVCVCVSVCVCVCVCVHTHRHMQIY